MNNVDILNKADLQRLLYIVHAAHVMVHEKNAELGSELDVLSEKLTYMYDCLEARGT